MTGGRSGEEPGVGDVFAALTDPTRRAVVERLARGACRAGELAASLSMTPPTLSRHLRVLRKSGLIGSDDLDHDARVRLYRLRPEALAPLHGWLDGLAAFWGDQLPASKAHAEATKTPATKTPASKRAPRGTRRGPASRLR